MRALYVHNNETDVEVVHLLDGRLPVLDFDGTLAVGDHGYFPGPCFLAG